MTKYTHLLRAKCRTTLLFILAVSPKGSPPRGGFKGAELSESEARKVIEKGIKSTKGYEYSMCGHAEACVEKYLELAEKDRASLKLVPTPTIDDHQLSDGDLDDNTGVVAPV